MIYSEMVGRDKELNKLELQVMMAINGKGLLSISSGRPESVIKVGGRTEKT